MLPPSVSGKAHDPVVTPAGGVAAKVAAADRFKVPGFPAGTLAAVESAKDAAGWLTRMSKADGRFVPGLDPTLRRELPGTDMDQAAACLALARAARFTGDEKTTATASQACLTLLTLTKPDPADATLRVPTLADGRGNKVGFAAVLATAIYDLPAPDATLTAEADRLCKFLYTRLRSDGSVHYTDGTEPPEKADPVGVHTYPGLCFQALLASDRVRPEGWKAEAVGRGVGYYRGVFHKGRTPELCAAMLPAVCDLALRGKAEAATAFAFEMADWVCDQQYAAADVRDLRWVGGIRPAGGGEPTALTAGCAEGLSAAVTLTTQVPDAGRFTRYRAATLSALTFARAMQFSAANRNADHFEQGFRTQWLYGGVHGSPGDGAVRADHTARLLAGVVRFLESGAEKAE
jgi:hypothetical protein